MQNEQNYYLGLDIGTNSVGYAVTNEYYVPLKFKGEPMLGVHIFDSANASAERRAFRTARRRLNRRQHRIELLQEIFADEIYKTDKRFFIRIKESGLCRSDVSDTGDAHIYFNEKEYSDKDYYREYPTIHHLIHELMTNKAPHDIRLVYIACAWLVAHRGHFLNGIDEKNTEGVPDFESLYTELKDYCDRNDVKLWNFDSGESFAEILKSGKDVSKREKEKALRELLYGEKKPENDRQVSAVINLLCGGKVSFEKLFDNKEYAELEKKDISLDMTDEDFGTAIAPIGDDSEFILKLKAIYDWSVLDRILNGSRSLSEAKIKVYERHKKDLENLKRIIKTYAPEKYNRMFREIIEKKANYPAYTYNVKDYNVSCGDSIPDKYGKGKEDFCKFVDSEIKDIEIKDEEDKAVYDDIKRRTKDYSFMPKQTDGDNRVIPYQLYLSELEKILKNAEEYFPFLSEEDSDGITPKEKILSIFSFRVPYFVGPLNSFRSKNAWLKRKAEGIIYPWNFENKVDLDASEENFIRRMTNTCTYIPGEDVLPKNSLLYSKYTVLNEINNIKIKGVKISPEIKQALYEDVFMKYTRVTPKRVHDYLCSAGVCSKEEKTEGLDESIKSSLKSAIDFKRLIASGKITEADAEKIIERSTYAEDSARLRRWLKREYPKLPDEDISFISKLKYRDFGRFSKKLLDGILVTCQETGETDTVIGWLWNSEYNFMELTSQKFNLASQLEDISREYYADHPLSLSERLDEMYVPKAVKRPIIRTLRVVEEIEKTLGKAPAAIFVEMARGADSEQKNKRSVTRKKQLEELYKKLDGEDVREMNAELDRLGEKADNVLQSDRVFLYFMQLGKCLYSGKTIENLSRLSDGTFNIEHIYPRSFVKDDSILNNEILVDSKINAEKTNIYPVPEKIREKMLSYWVYLKKAGLITEEKFKRLTRDRSFTPEERWEFINRQLVETRQSAKVITSLLKEKFGKQTRVIYVKAGLAAELRHEVLKSDKTRSINDLHHAKDAYLNIVAGNVYGIYFDKARFFENRQNDYTVKATELFGHNVEGAHWNGGASIAKVKKIIDKNAVHYSRYTLCKKGGFFDQLPVKAGEGLIERKAGLPTEKYGGYKKTSASFFVLTAYRTEKGRDLMIMPVDLLIADLFRAESAFAADFAVKQIGGIIGKPVLDVSFPLKKRIIKINTILSLDGVRFCITGKGGNGKQLLLSCATSNILRPEWEKYIKAAESLLDKKENNPAFVYDEKYDRVSREKNLELYDILTEKAGRRPFSLMPAQQYKTLSEGRGKFAAIEDMAGQLKCLMQILSIFKTGRASGCDLTSVGGTSTAAVTTISTKLSNIAKSYKDVRFIDISPAGLYENISANLVQLL